MDEKKDILLLSLITLCYKTGGNFAFDVNDKYFYDEEVIDCKLSLYWLLLSKEREEQDKLFKDFEEKYIKLSKEKQEYIREHLRKIFEEQDKNNKEKEKKL